MNWVFLRGLVREQRHWAGFPQTMVQRLGGRALCIDLPGMGTEFGKPIPSTVSGFVDDMRPRFLEARGDAKEPWSIFAVSLGGMVTLNWVERYPDDFQRAVVVNTSAGDLSSPFERFNPKNLGRVLTAATTSDPYKRERTILSFSSNAAPERLDRLATEWADIARARRVPVSVLLRQISAATRSKSPTKLTTPTLVLASTADRLVSVECSKRIAKKLDLPIRLHSSGGHDLPFDDADWVIDQVNQWVRA